MRLGIFGGTFDPVHLGHLLLAETARDECELDRVVFVPAGIPPNKLNRSFSAGEHRYEMLCRTVEPYANLEVSRFEIDHPEISYTVRTVRHFQALYPDATLFLIVGSETLADIPRWHETRQLCQLVSIIVAWRAGMPEPDFAPFSSLVSSHILTQWKSQVIPMPKIELSATEIRRRVAAGKSIRFRVSNAVEEYIEQNDLYRVALDSLGCNIENG